MNIYNPNNCPFEVRVHYGECSPVDEKAHIAKWWEIFFYRLFGKRIVVETPQGKVVGYKFRGGTLLYKINFAEWINE